MIDKEKIYSSITLIIIILIIIISIMIIIKPKDCIGKNDVYLHCMGLLDESNSFCNEQEWAKDPYELKKDQNFCLYFRKYKEAVAHENVDACLSIQHMEDFEEYDCLEDPFGCPDQPLSCYVALSKDESACDELNKINIKGFSQEEKEKYCRGMFALDKVENFYEDELFINADDDSKNTITLILSIRKKDPSLCQYMADTQSRDYAACQIYSNVRKYDINGISKEFCDSFKECNIK